jgi:integrase
MKLTQTSVNKLSLPGGKSDAIFFDEALPSFGLRIRAGGSRKYVVHYRQGGIQRRHTIGSANALTLEEARRKARKVLVAVDDGKNPAAERAHTRAAAGLIFGTVVDEFLAAQSHLKPHSLIMTTHHLKNHWKPLHKLALGAISRALIAAHMRVIAKQSGIASANRARSALSTMFAWAIGEGLCESNPVIGTNKAGEEKPRDRVLSDSELVAIWKALPDSDYGRVVKLLMLTGQRREEIGGLRWTEINTEARVIELSGSRSKNSLPHKIPLCDEAMAILKACLQCAGRDLVFGEGENGFGAWSRSKAALDAAMGINQPWVLHDLRRTAATGMADLGVQPHIIEAVLNHISGHKAGVAGIYNRSTYENEKRAALELWAKHVSAAVNGSARGGSDKGQLYEGAP